MSFSGVLTGPGRLVPKFATFEEFQLSGLEGGVGGLRNRPSVGWHVLEVVEEPYFTRYGDTVHVRMVS